MTGRESRPPQVQEVGALASSAGPRVGQGSLVQGKGGPQGGLGAWVREGRVPCSLSEPEPCAPGQQGRLIAEVLVSGTCHSREVALQ